MFALSLIRQSSLHSPNRQSTTRKRRLSCELLEDRRVLAVVTSLADSGAGSLREALAGADPTITFAVSGMIDLLSELAVSRDVVVDGAGQSVTVRNTVAASRVFNVDDGTATVLNVTLRNLTITGGDIADTSPSTVGGGVRVNNENLTMENSTVSGNSARSGGGIGLVGTASVTLDNVTVADNAARVNGGGVSVPANGSALIIGSRIDGNTVGLNNPTITTLAIGGGVHLFGTVTVRDSFVRDNLASTVGAASMLGYGGGIGVSTGGNLTVERTEILGNMADRGGGLSVRRAPIVIRDSVISGNTSSDNGGGIRLMRSATAPVAVTIENTTFSGNSGYGGGGIGGSVYAGSEVSTSTLTVTGSTIDNNESTFDGGGLELFGTSTMLENVTVSGNSAVNQGGGIWNSFSAVFTGSTSVNFATITANSAVATGGGVYSGEATFAMHNSIVSGNAATSGLGLDLYDSQYLSGIPVDVRYSLLADTSGHVVANGVMGNITGMTANLSLLGDNGGPTQTHLLMTGPGIDGGDPASTVMVDQRGFTRPGANSSRDMGAVESDGESPVLNLDFSGDGNYDCADMDLLESAIDAGMPVAAFDVNGDGMLSSADVFEWLLDAGELRFGPGRFFKSGDANLDGSVDGSDFGIWNSHKFTTANRWCQGDLNQDDFVDGSDFGVWNSNKFTASDAVRGTLTQGRLRTAGSNFPEANDDMLEQSAPAVPTLARSAIAVHWGPKTAGAPPIKDAAQTHPHSILDAVKAPTATGDRLRISFSHDGKNKNIREVLFSELENW